MKKLQHWPTILAVLAISLGSCKKDQKTTAVDPCGNSYETSNVLGTLTGVYSGTKSCILGNAHTTINTSIKVCLDPNHSDQILINDIAVVLDTTCFCVEHPFSIGGYTIYSPRFFKDSLTIYTDSGGLGNPTTCQYALKKE